MKVKVFRIWKMLEVDLKGRTPKEAIKSVKLTIDALKLGWALELEGKTKDECEKTIYSLCDSWFTEEEREDPSNAN